MSEHVKGVDPVDAPLRPGFGYYIADNGDRLIGLIGAEEVNPVEEVNPDVDPQPEVS